MDKDAYERIRTLFIAVLAVSVTAVGIAAAWAEAPPCGFAAPSSP